MGEHDQRFKALLRAFFGEFFELFFPEYAADLDFSQLEWLDKEVFPDPPEGKRRELDLVARVPTRRPIAFFDDEPVSETLALVHVEIESGESSMPIRARMARYFFFLSERYDLPILPIVVFLRVGLDGTGVLSHVAKFGRLETLRFQFAYVGLPALNALEYLESENDLGVALSALMAIPPSDRPRLKAETLQRIALAHRNEQERYLLAECVEAYLPLENSDEQQAFEQLMATKQYEDAKMMGITTFERGMERGLEKGERAMLTILLEERFGPLGPEARQRLDEWPAEELPALARRILHVQSLAELGLEG